MDITQIKRAFHSKDQARQNAAILDLLNSGYTEREAYRVALAALPDLTSDEWQDMLARSKGVIPTLKRF